MITQPPNAVNNNLPRRFPYSPNAVMPIGTATFITLAHVFVKDVETAWSRDDILEQTVLTYLAHAAADTANTTSTVYLTLRDAGFH